VPLVQLQRLVLRAGRVVEQLAAARFGRFVGTAVEDEHGQRHERKPLLQPLVRAHHRRQRSRRLRLVRDERISVHRCNGLRIAREVFVLEVQNVRVWREMAQPFEDGERKVRGRQLVRKALADQAGELRLVIEGEQTGDDAAGAVS